MTELWSMSHSVPAPAADAQAPVAATDPAAVVAGLVRAAWAGAPARSVPGVTGPVDWDAVNQLVDAELVGPLLHGALARDAAVPEAVRSHWRTQYTQTALRNTALLHSLGEAVAALEADGIAVLVLKGAALVGPVYGNVALRPMRDVDILVRPTDAARAVQRLRALEYAPADPEVHPGTQLRFENEMRLQRADATGTVIDLHWSVVDSPYYQPLPAFARLWETAVRQAEPTGDGPPLRVLAPAEQFLHLCAHLVLHHHEAGLLWQHDLAALVQRCGGAIDWQAVLDGAQALHLVLPLQRVLAILLTTWQVEAVRPIAHAAAALEPSAAEVAAFGRSMAYHGPVAQRFWHDLRGLPTAGARVRYFLRHMFPRPAYIQAQYGVSSPRLVPFYYFVRYWRGAVSVLRVARARLRGASARRPAAQQPRLPQV